MSAEHINLEEFGHDFYSSEDEEEQIYQIAVWFGTALLCCDLYSTGIQTTANNDNLSKRDIRTIDSMIMRVC